MRKTIPKGDSKRIINILLLLAGSYVAYTAGAASVGPLRGFGYEMIYLLLFGSVSILVGAWMYSPRIIHTISYDYSNIGPRRSTAALLSPGIIAQVGIQLGVPVSFNLAIIAAVIGSGMVAGTENKNSEKIGLTVLRWVSAFFLAGGLPYLLGTIWNKKTFQPIFDRRKTNLSYKFLNSSFVGCESVFPVTFANTDLHSPRKSAFLLSSFHTFHRDKIGKTPPSRSS